MLKISPLTPLKNNQGMATLEIIPIITVIVLLLNFSLGFFGAIHTGILQSISSRNYAFSTFAHRADLTYFRNSHGVKPIAFNEVGMRVHATISEKNDGSQFAAAARKIAFFDKANAAEVEGNNDRTHVETSNLAAGRNEKLSVNPIWIKTTYGICLNSDCKGIR